MASSVVGSMTPPLTTQQGLFQPYSGAYWSAAASDAAPAPSDSILSKKARRDRASATSSGVTVRMPESTSLRRWNWEGMTKLAPMPSMNERV